MAAKEFATARIGGVAEERGRRQMDLFGPVEGRGGGAPLWLDLPDQARMALTELMMRLILDHAGQFERHLPREASDDL